ncbi:MAG: FKBP-type peptidyl-prolyl cis-trans isomerase [Bacteroidales bacterium]|nr:FKBP-type peptidyl-prolyl cis-trans isomerase [Bacteroidales bacterium]
MKYKISILISIITCFTISCKEKNEYKTTEHGLTYKYIVKSDSTLLPQEGNKLALDVCYYDSNDSLLFNSQDISSKFIMDFTKPTAEGSTINDALAMMHEGDSMSFLINAYEFYLFAGQTKKLKDVSRTENLRFEIKLKKILSPEIVQKEQEKKMEELKNEEEELLKEFLENNYPDLQPTKSGLYFVETREGEGPTVGKSNKVAIHYTATYINGEPIYSTYQKNDPLIFDVADPLVWPCLAESVLYMKKGSKATCIAVSKLAAGENGDKAMHIAPRKTIIFDIELIAFK